MKTALRLLLAASVTAALGCDPLAAGTDHRALSTSSPGSDGGDGSPLTIVTDDVDYPWALAADDDRVYFAEFGLYGMANGDVRSCPVTGCDGGSLVYATGLETPSSLAIDDRSVYWVTTDLYSSTGDVLQPGAIASCPLAGCPDGGPVRLAAAADPYGIAIDADYVYWVDNADQGSVHRVPKADGGADEVLYAGGPIADGGPSTAHAQYVAVDSTSVYFSNAAGDMFRLPRTGGTPERVAVGFADSTLDMGLAWPLAVDPTNLYYGEPGLPGDAGAVYRIDKAGTEAPVALVPGLTAAASIVLDPPGSAGAIYFADWGTGEDDGRVGKLVGSRLTWLASPQWAPATIAVNSRFVFWTNYNLTDSQGASVRRSGRVVRADK